MLLSAVAFFCGAAMSSAAFAGLCIIPSALRALKNADVLALRLITGGAHIDSLPTVVRRVAVRHDAEASRVLSQLKAGEYSELVVVGENGSTLAVLSAQALYSAVIKGAKTMSDAAGSAG